MKALPLADNLPSPVHEYDRFASGDWAANCQLPQPNDESTTDTSGAFLTSIVYALLQYPYVGHLSSFRLTVNT